MKNLQKIILAALCCLFIAMVIVYDPPEDTDNRLSIRDNPVYNINPIEKDRAFNVITELSSETYSGRLAGTEGNEKAVEYIIEQYKDIGLLSPASLTDYKQVFNQLVVYPKQAPILRTVNKAGEVTAQYHHLTDFLARTTWAKSCINGEITAPLLLITETKQLRENNSELNGKVLLIDEAVVKQFENSDLKTDGVVQKILNLSADIKGIILNYDIRRDGYYPVSNSLSRFFEQGKAFSSKGPLILYCKDSVFQQLSQSCSNSEDAYLNFNYQLIEYQSTNLIGVIEGTDTPTQNEYLIICAHLDHVGDNLDGTYNPGALDNASGVAGLLEIARSMKTENPPKKTIVFIAFNGEEEYLAGSRHYVDNPIYPLDKSTVINLDMIGTKASDVLLIGSVYNHAKDLSDELYDYGQALDISCWRDTAVASDHLPFSEKGVPAVILINIENTPLVHTIHDSPVRTIDINKFVSVVNLVLHYLINNAT